MINVFGISMTISLGAAAWCAFMALYREVKNPHTNAKNPWFKRAIVSSGICILCFVLWRIALNNK